MQCSAVQGNSRAASSGQGGAGGLAQQVSESSSYYSWAVDDGDRGTSEMQPEAGLDRRTLTSYNLGSSWLAGWPSIQKAHRLCTPPCARTLLEPARQLGLNLPYHLRTSASKTSRLHDNVPLSLPTTGSGSRPLVILLDNGRVCSATFPNRHRFLVDPTCHLIAPPARPLFVSCVTATRR